MLIADPSSTCDICFEKFSSNRECWCIPCGHVFCRECLTRLTQFVCPVCRASLGSANIAARPARRVHIDMSKCGGDSLTTEGPDSQSTRRLKKLEQRIVSMALQGRGLTVQRAAELAEEVGEFLRTQSPNEYGLLRTIETLLAQLSVSMAHVYEDTSLSKAVKASYEHRIKQLEQSLKEQTRHLSRDERSEQTREPSGHASVGNSSHLLNSASLPKHAVRQGKTKTRY